MGYCLLWSVFLLELRLKHIDVELFQIQSNLIDTTYYTLKNQYPNDENKQITNRLGDRFQDFIRDYGLYLHDLYGLKRY